MAEKVNIASLSINVDDVIKESVRLRGELDKLKESQKKLDKSTAEGAAEFQKNEAKLKNLSKAYRDNQQFAAALDEANKDLTKTMQVEGKSTQELYDSRAQLNKIAKNIKGNTEEEIAQREKLNQAIDAQTEAIKKQAPGYIQQKENIGNYTESINKADFNLKSFILNSKEAGGASNYVSGGLKFATKQMLSFTKATIAFLATPIGFVLGLIAGAFVLIKNAMNRSEESTQKIKTAFAGFSGIAKGLFKILEPLGKFLIDGIAKGFELVEKSITNNLKLMQKALDFLGFEKAAEKLNNFTNKIEESARASRELTMAEYELEKAQRNARKTQLLYQRDAEKLRQIRDDEARSIPERIKANEDLGKVLQKQLSEELSIAEKALDVANKRIALEGETKEALDARAEAETEIADIQERITGQTSEQLTNRVALQKEAAQQAIAIQEAELNAYLSNQSVKAKSLEESLKVEKEAAKQKIAILDNELKNKLITQQEYNSQYLEIQNELLKKNAELAEDNARRELELYIQNNKSKLDNDKFLSEQAYNDEVQLLENLAQARRKFEKTRLVEGIISQQEYNDNINIINEENRLKNEELAKEREEAEKEKRAIDAENYLLFLEEQGANQFELLTTRLKKEEQAEIQAAEKTGANVKLIQKKYAQAQLNIEKELKNARLAQSKELFGNLAELLGENTAAGKAAGIAQATINTYQGVTEVWRAQSVLPEPLGTIVKLASTATVLASGLSAVNKIRSTPTKFAAGDILKGRSHSRGGIPFSIAGSLGYEAEGGEAIINKRSTSMFAPLLSAINQAGGGKKFAVGGIAGSNSLPSTALINYDLLAAKVAEANASLPNPVVSVEEINTVSNNIAVVESLASG